MYLKKTKRSVGILSKLRYYVKIDIFTNLSYSLIHPFLTYGIIIGKYILNYTSSSQAPVIQDKLNAELSKIKRWLSFNCLFEAMLFGPAPRLSAVNSFSTTLNNVIKGVFHFTYLGIVINDRFSWKEKIKHLISKAGKRVRISAQQASLKPYQRECICSFL